MANVWVTATGTMYTATNATDPSDSQLVNPTANLIASLSASPISLVTAEAAAAQLVDNAGLDANNFQATAA